MFKRKPKKIKPQAIETYTVSYLDKRSKTYHKIVMTSFVGVFGLAGAAYLFSSSAATSNTGSGNNSYTPLILVAASLILVAIILVFAIFFVSRSGRK